MSIVTVTVALMFPCLALLMNFSVTTSVRIAVDISIYFPFLLNLIFQETVSKYLDKSASSLNSAVLEIRQQQLLLLLLLLLVLLLTSHLVSFLKTLL